MVYGNAKRLWKARRFTKIPAEFVGSCTLPRLAVALRMQIFTFSEYMKPPVKRLCLHTGRCGHRPLRREFGGAFCGRAMPAPTRRVRILKMPNDLRKCLPAATARRGPTGADVIDGFPNGPMGASAPTQGFWRYVLRVGDGRIRAVRFAGGRCPPLRGVCRFLSIFGFCACLPAATARRGPTGAAIYIGECVNIARGGFYQRADVGIGPYAMAFMSGIIRYGVSSALGCRRFYGRR